MYAYGDRVQRDTASKTHRAALRSNKPEVLVHINCVRFVRLVLLHFASHANSAELANGLPSAFMQL